MQQDNKPVGKSRPACPPLHLKYAPAFLFYLQGEFTYNAKQLHLCYYTQLALYMKKGFTLSCEQNGAF